MIFLKPLKVKINLIPYNPIKNTLMKPSKEEQVNLFVKYFKKKSIPITVRRSRGKSLQGACGQFVFDKTHN